MHVDVDIATNAMFGHISKNVETQVCTLDTLQVSLKMCCTDVCANTVLFLSCVQTRF